MQIVSCKWPLSKPSSDDVQIAINQSSSMTIPPSWLKPSGLLCFNPDIFISVEYSQAAMVLFAVVATEDEQLLLVKG